MSEPWRSLAYTVLVEEWRLQGAAVDGADDHARCVHCHDQLAFCDCYARMAVVIAEVDHGVTRAEGLPDAEA